MTPGGPPNGHDQRRAYDDVLAHMSHKRRKQRASSRRRGRRSVLASMFVVLGIGLGVLLIGTAVGGAVAVDDTLSGVSLDSLQQDPPGVNSRIYAADGSLLTILPSTENRTPVASDQISPWLKQATVAIEDRRFYDHGGVDFQGVLRAALDNLEAGQIEQGGSTIEQQVVRNLYLSDEQSFTRKIREAYLAMQMSDRWTKDQILTEYLNIVPYGAITYGCEAAAQRYFDKSCKKLNLWEAATLAGIPQNPLVYNPVDNRQAAKQRRNDVLDAMLAQGVITQRQHDQAEAHKIIVHASPYLDPTPSKYGYFISYVRDVLAKRWPAQTVRKGGLAVHTSLDKKLQLAAHDALTSTINWADAPAAAMVAIDPRTGEVLAMDSSVPYSKSQQFNFPVAARRQAGSTFKAFTLATAISQGINPNTSSELSAHLSYTVPGTLEPWEVDTAEGSECNCPTTITQGTIESDNTVFARLSIDVGPNNIAEMAHKLGIPRWINLNTGPAVTLGVNPVSPLWMTSAYATLANNGIRHDPDPIETVSSIETGKTLEKDSHKGKRVIPDGVAYETDSVLAQTVHGTASKTPLYHGVQGGKTGTTNDHKDAWFCGFTPTLAACVWLGYPKGEIPMETLPVYGAAFGGDYPAMVWTKFMNSAFAARPAKFPPVDAWPLPQNPVQWKPFTSQFPTYIHIPTCVGAQVSTPSAPCNVPVDTGPTSGDTKGNGGGNGGGGGSAGGGGGGGGTGAGGGGGGGGGGSTPTT